MFDEKMQRGVILGLFLIVVFGLLWACAGCAQTIHGLALDVESGARYVADHTVVDR